MASSKNAMRPRDGLHATENGAVPDDATSSSMTAFTAGIVAAYLKHNAVSAPELQDLFGDVHATLVRLAARPAAAPQPEARRPAVPIRKSVMPDYIVCLEDGQTFKSLKRHLRARYNMSPDEYRAKWGLPDDYPVVAPAYARERSQLAKMMGLGQQRRRKPS